MDKRLLAMITDTAIEWGIWIVRIALGILAFILFWTIPAWLTGLALGGLREGEGGGLYVMFLCIEIAIIGFAFHVRHKLKQYDHENYE